MYEQLELPIGAIVEADRAPPGPPLPLHDLPADAVAEQPDEAPASSDPFGAWLLVQKDRRGLIGLLAKAASADAGFPKRGTPDEVRARLGHAGAEGDMFEAVDDAEAAWAAEG